MHDKLADGGAGLGGQSEAGDARPPTMQRRQVDDQSIRDLALGIEHIDIDIEPVQRLPCVVLDDEGPLTAAARLRLRPVQLDGDARGLGSGARGQSRCEQAEKQKPQKRVRHHRHD